MNKTLLRDGGKKNRPRDRGVTICAFRRQEGKKRKRLRGHRRKGSHPKSKFKMLAIVKRFDIETNLFSHRSVDYYFRVAVKSGYQRRGLQEGNHQGNTPTYKGSPCTFKDEDILPESTRPIEQEKRKV